MSVTIAKKYSVHIREVCELIYSLPPEHSQRLVDYFQGVVDQYRAVADAGEAVGLECIRQVERARSGEPMDCEVLVDLVPKDLFPDQDESRVLLLDAIFSEAGSTPSTTD